MSSRQAMYLDKKAEVLLFELDAALEHGLGNPGSNPLISEIASALCTHLINHVSPLTFKTPREVGQQRFEKRLRRFRFSEIVGSLGKKIQELQDLGEKLEADEVLKEVAAIDETPKDYDTAKIEHKKRKRAQEVERKLDELDDWHKKMRLNIFGKVRSSSATVEGEKAVVLGPAARPAASEAIPVTEASTTPADVNTRSVPRSFVVNDEDWRKTFDRLLANQHPSAVEIGRGLSRFLREEPTPATQQAPSQDSVPLVGPPTGRVTGPKGR